MALRAIYFQAILLRDPVQKYLVYYRYNHLLEPALELPELGVPGLVRPCSLMEAFLMYSWVS